MNLTPGDVRSLVFECLRKARPFNPEALPFTIETLCAEIAQLAKVRGLLTANGNPGWIDLRHNAVALHPHIKVDVHDTVWDLLIEGVVRPGSGEHQLELPAIHITAHGTQVTKGGVTPYDPDGFLKEILTKVPNVDQIILKYVAESAETLRRNCLLSSTITLGCASEKAFLIVVEKYADALNVTDQTNFSAAIKNARGIKRQHAEFKDKWYQPKLRPMLSKSKDSDWLTAFDDCLQFVFGYFRDVRNDAGHPTGVVFTREKVHSHLVIFPYYLRLMYDLIEWLDSHKPI